MVVGFHTILTASNASDVAETLYTLPASTAGGEGGGTSVHELSVALPTRPGTINGTAYIDGRAIVSLTPIVNVTSLSVAEVAAHSFDGVCDRLSWGRETPLFAPFIYEMHHFAKTGSGQT